MQASLKLGLAFAASALWSAPFAQSILESATSVRVEQSPTQQRQTPDTSFGDKVGRGAAESPASGAAAQAGVAGGAVPGGAVVSAAVGGGAAAAGAAPEAAGGAAAGGAKPPVGYPDVSKVPAPPGAPVPIPYPSTPLDTPAAIKTPLDRPLTRAEPSPVKIEPVKTPLPVVRPVQPPSPTPAWPSKIESIGIKQSR